METELSVDDVFDSLCFSLTGTAFKESMKSHGKSEKAKQIAEGLEAYPFGVKKANTATSLLYRQIPLPWYVTMQCFGD